MVVERDMTGLVTENEMFSQLSRIEGHITRADAWANNYLAAFPHLDNVSIQFGVGFGLDFAITLTWQK